MTTLHTVLFQKTVLATFVGLCLSQSVFALQEISDEGLSEATGEGIALLPQNAFMVFRGDNAGNETLPNILSDRTKDTGYIRYVPVGPLTSTALDYNKDNAVNSNDNAVGKADLFLYGLAISNADKNSNNRIGSDPYIKSWGTPTNPWILKVATDKEVPNFNTSTTCLGANDTSCHVTYLSLEAPLYDKDLPSSTASDADINGSSAYNLKLGLWADAFVRNPNVAEDMSATGNQFNLGAMYGSTATDRANRLRMQMIWDGLSINGSRIQMFQTLGGVGGPNDAGINQGLSVFYNNTLGMAGVLRFNSGDTQSLRANVTVGSQSRTYGGWTISGGSDGSASATPTFDEETSQFRFRTRTVTDSQSNIAWQAPTTMSVLRLSTRECLDGTTTGTGTSTTCSAAQSKLNTPAINGGNAPVFNQSEGLFLYSPNINLVLGSLYQPLIVGSDGKDFNLELAAIPNKPEIYKKIYTDYRTVAQGKDTSYLGSTCNVYQCGTDVTIGGKSYQGYNATHSSISIGSTQYDSASNRLYAYSGVEAVGVSFGALGNRAISGTQNVTRNEVQYQQRQKRTQTYVVTDRYRLTDGGLFSSAVDDPYGGSTCSSSFGSVDCNRWKNIQGRYTDWVYLTSINASGQKQFTNSDGTYAIYCTVAYACLAGTPMNGGVGAGGNTNTPSQTTPTFVAGMDDCWTTGAMTDSNCNGSFSGDGVKGLSRLTGGGGTITASNNRSWTYGSRSGWDTNDSSWFKVDQNGQIIDGRAAAIHGNANAIPTSITTVNASPLNNFGSAVIDGVLIQHMKISTKGL